jgi:hypothetical protein
MVFVTLAVLVDRGTLDVRPIADDDMVAIGDDQPGDQS